MKMTHKKANPKEETLNDIIGHLNDFGVFNFSGIDQKSTSSVSTDSAKCLEDDTGLIEENERTNEEFQSALNLTEEETEKTPNNIEAVYAKLEKYLRSFKALPELKQIEKYSIELTKKLDRDLEELDFTMKETKATIENIQRIKKQRHYVKKELSKMRNNLNKVQQEELKEMELVVAVYDKDLLRRWHLIKKTNSPHSMEGFLNNVIGKRQAVDNIYKMAKEKLEALKRSGATSSLPALADKILIETGAFPQCDERFSNS